MSRALPTRRVFSALMLTLGLMPAAVSAGGDPGETSDPALVASAVRPAFTHPVWSPDGGHLLLSGPAGNGLYLYDARQKTLLELTRTPSSGYAAFFSPDGTKVAFKRLVPGETGAFLQIPVVYDLKSRQLTALTGAVPLAGVPTFSSDGRVAFTVGETLRVLDRDGRLERTIPLDHYANLAPISPDGRFVAYSDRTEAIQVLELATGRSRQVTPAGEAFFFPQWSPDGKRLLVSTLGARLMTLDLAGGRHYWLEQGERPTWSADSRAVIYTQLERRDGAEVISADVYRMRFDGTKRLALTHTPTRLEAEAALSPDGRTLAWAGSGEGGLFLTQTSLERPIGSSDEARGLWNEVSRFDALKGPELPPAPRASEAERSDPAATVKIAGVPYIHQVYDTRDDFNGNSACGATSAMMTIAFYDILPYWDCTASTPYSHTSHYGNYISEIYTFNGHTYNIGEYSPNNVLEYGGYGYITQNDWEDTKGHMAEYLTYHKLSSGVDWSPSWSKLQTEANAGKPFVMLNSLTSSGHYIVSIGYLDAQHTAVFNDPYGDKNDGYTNYNGAGAMYDWPGYNNGYANLTNVWCFIWARGSATPPAQTGNLMGYVRENDIYTGAPLAATVTLQDGRSDATDSSGLYRFDALPVGTWTLTASAKCYQSVTVTRTVSAGVDTWGSIALKKDGSCDPGNLEGYVKDETTGEVLAGASLTLSTGATSMADANGYYRFASLTAGTYTVTASAECHAEGRVSVNVAGGTTARADLFLAAEGCESGCAARLSGGGPVPPVARGGAGGVVAVLGAGLAVQAFRRRRRSV